VTPVLLECPEVPVDKYVLEIIRQSGVEKCTLGMESDIPAEKCTP
jgi:hypothetical protein